jgi:hypothetical protein
VLAKRKGVTARWGLNASQSVEQNCDLTNRNWIGGRRDRMSWPETAKSISTKGHGCKSSRCAVKAVGLTPGDLHSVSKTGLRGPKGTLIRMQESAEGIVDERELIEGPNGWSGE